MPFAGSCAAVSDDVLLIFAILIWDLRNPANIQLIR
jgi:hypothetical protein